MQTKQSRRKPGRKPRWQWCLDSCGKQTALDGPICQHETQGQRVVVNEGEVFVFEPPTNMQAGIWLQSKHDGLSTETKEAMIRWLCYECGTIQETSPDSPG